MKTLLNQREHFLKKNMRKEVSIMARSKDTEKANSYLDSYLDFILRFLLRFRKTYILKKENSIQNKNIGSEIFDEYAYINMDAREITHFVEVGCYSFAMLIRIKNYKRATLKEVSVSFSIEEQGCLIFSAKKAEFLESKEEQNVIEKINNCLLSIKKDLDIFLSI